MKSFFSVLFSFLLLASPCYAIDVYISDQGGSHVGYCHDNSLWADAVAANGDANAGGKNVFFVGDVLNDDIFAIMRFDLSSIPDAATIVSAEMVLECDAVVTGQNVTAYQTATANDDWNEGTSDWATEANTSCWNDEEYDEVSEWAGGAGCNTSGTDYINTALTDTVDCTSTGTKTFTFNADGIAAIQGELSDDTLELHLLPGNWNNGEYSRFHSSEAATAGNRPYLKVVYTLPQLLIIRR
jgi:hypothetical protein